MNAIRHIRLPLALAVLLACTSAFAGAISGFVTATSNGAPIADGWVRIHNSAGSSVGTAFLGNDGSYSLTGLAAGSYYARTESTGFFDEIWNNLPCPQRSCSPTGGNIIAVTTSGTTVANFSLDRGAAINGVVTAAGGAPIPDGWVRIYGSTGTSLGTAFLENNGTFSYAGLAAGTYYARTEATGFFDELWNNIPCAQRNCTPTTGNPITLTAGGTFAANFTLEVGGAVGGTVLADPSQQPVSDGWVRIYSAAGVSLGTAFLGADGTYRYGGLAGGNVFARTESTGMNDELWNNIPCASGACTPASGTPILVSSGVTTANFSLSSGGGIAGTVTATVGGVPIESGWVRIFNSAGTSVGTAFLAADGSYAFGGLSAGTYYARTEETNYFDEAWNNIPCPRRSCSATSGNPIAVGSTGVVVANFVLDVGGSITGTVLAHATSVPISTGWVRVYNSSGTSLGTAFLGVAGEFSYRGLGSGSYYARTENTGADDELWENIPCFSGNCVPTNGHPISVIFGAGTDLPFRLGAGDEVYRNGFE